jgi:hypothetical protein
MTGPKIIGMAPEPAAITPQPKRTGIMRGRSRGEWIAVREGRMVDAFSGAGSKAAAIRSAGTNAVIA